MCCFASEDSKASLLKRFGNHKTLKLWKHVNSSGDGDCSCYQYSPGGHVAKTQKGFPWVGPYNVNFPRGIHVYCREPRRGGWLVTLPVVVRKEDLVCVDSGQAVFRKIRILKKDWIATGLPLKKVKA